MKIFFSPYQLKLAQSPNARSENAMRLGALLKVESGSGTGYADLCPFPELGDAYLRPELKALKEGRPSVLGRQSLWLADRDARARAEGRNLVRREPALRNNFLIEDPKSFGPQHLENVREMGFHTAKVKMGRDLAHEIEWLNASVLSGLRLRLDFNSSLTAAQFAAFQKAVSPAVDASIDYVEDPCAYAPESWAEFRRRWPLALDREMDALAASAEKPQADVLIIKPARQDVDLLGERAREWNLKVTVTSMMDHPVGGLHAFACAQELRERGGNPVGDAGCLTLRLDPANDFSKAVRVEGPFILPTAGRGIGFDELLERQNWLPLDKA
ncbi:MAG: hypothetical protein KF802_11790 [Bdellovibrionaceae bacterium]|nr:hypothetical protein [Pseudobdellovibrionaceae bacterium]MBX3032795.1 hypothetical protein [Pseudobdellovibrionaceae bacterium]